jgi:hypothetical protein
MVDILTGQVEHRFTAITKNQRVTFNLFRQNQSQPRKNADAKAATNIETISI